LIIFLNYTPIIKECNSYFVSELIESISAQYGIAMIAGEIFLNVFLILLYSENKIKRIIILTSELMYGTIIF